jgi:hypothetical protein
MERMLLCARIAPICVHTTQAQKALAESKCFGIVQSVHPPDLGRLRHPIGARQESGGGAPNYEGGAAI